MQRYLDYEQIKKNRRNSMIIVILFGIVGFLILYGISNYYEMGTTFTVVSLIVSIVMTYITYSMSHITVIASVGARKADPSNPKEKEMMDILENLCKGVEIEKVPELYIMQSEQMNAFATGLSPKNGVICLTTGIIEKLNRTEIEGVMAHELSHIVNYDIRLSAVVVGMIGIISLLLEMVMRFGISRDRDNENNNAGLVYMLVIVAYYILLPIIGTIIQMAISRKREFMADAGAVQITRNPNGLKSALLKISGDNTPMEESSKIVSSLSIEETDLENRKKKRAGLFDSHPTIEERIEALDNLV